MLSTALSKILAAKALAAVVLLAGATGGVALAASSTTTHTQSQASTSTSTDDTDTASKSDDESVKPTTSKKPDNSKALDPSLQGLCRAFTSGGLKADKDHLPPAFDALVAAAGSAANVEKFCADQPAPGKSADAPGQVAKTSAPAKPADPSGEGDKAKATKKPEVGAADGDDEDEGSGDAKKGNSDDKSSPAKRSGQAADR
jgi:hypothetical protein